LFNKTKGKEKEKKEKMKLHMKSFALIVIAIMMASIATTAVTITPVKAQTASVPTGVTLGPPQLPYTGGPVPTGVTPSLLVPTEAYLSFSPDPIGVDQQLLVNLWTQPALDVERAHTGYTVIITKPDGSKITVGPMVSYAADTTAYFTYIPDTVGNYTIQFFFAGDYYPAGYYLLGYRVATAQSVPVGSYYAPHGGALTNTLTTTFNATQDCYYQPSQSAAYTLVVQQSQVASWQPSPLPGPGDYWTRPISPDNREWWVIAGNDPNNEVGGGTGTPGWPAGTNVYTSNSPLEYGFVPYTTGPTSAHIVFRRQGALDGIQGGLIDGAATIYQAPDLDFVGNPYDHGETGPGRFGNPNIVFQGRCYQLRTAVFNGVPQSVWECWDIQTGQVYWDIPNIPDPPTLISFNAIAPAVPGATSRADQLVATLTYLGSSAVAGTGLVIKYDPITGLVLQNQTIPLTSGFLYADPYVLSVQTLGTGASAQYRLINWTIDSLTSNFTANIMSNITWPFATLGTTDYESMISVTTYSATSPSEGTAPNPYVAAASLITGQLLFNVSSGIPYQIFSVAACIADHGIYALRMDNGYFYGFDLHTGKLDWQSPLTSYPWGSFGSYLSASAYGLFYYGQYDGVNAYNWTNGQLAWQFDPPSLPFETPYTNGTGNLNGEGYSFFGGGIIANGIYYTYSIEHSPTAPLTRGWSAFALNATTGALIWTTLGPMLPGVISDGYMTATNYYDGFQYVFGMGQSATTVSAPQTAISAGTPVIISGSVFDKSPAASTSPIYASGVGVPCVSDASMGDFMAYLYQQAPYPANITGVPVSIDAVGPSGNTIHITTVTSDASGTFHYMWTTPTTPGQYTITATFAGDDSYGFSSAETALGVITAPTVTATPTPTSSPASAATPSQVMTDVLIVGIAIIIAIAIVGILLLRKRP